MPADWMAPVRSALEQVDAPVTLFFRDDDAGWDDGRLSRLLDCFADLQTPIDLAVIPQAIGHELAESLFQRWQRDPSLLGLHQHGFAHANHETSGRKCEFGTSRSAEEQYDDLSNGRQRLAELLGPALDAIFTPPWNRCTETTGDCLASLGFLALSRDRTALPLHRSDLPELPVHVDWCGIRGRSATPWQELGRAVADRLQENRGHPLGIMLHHAVMDDEDLRHLAALLDLFKDSLQVHGRLMRECVPIGPS